MVNKLILDDWQKEIINDKSKYILLCKGRQIGGTSTLAEKAVKWMIEKKSRILVGSITEEQAKLVIVMVNNILMDRYRTMIKKGKDKPTQDRIRLTNGAEIRSRPVGTMGDAFRGFTADVNWFNEASKWPEIAFIAIMPTLLTTGGEIWADSTPFGKQGFFWDAFQNKNKLWKVYYKSSEDVINNRPINDIWTEERKKAAIRFLEDQKNSMSELQYGQEYLGLFLDDLQRYFSDEWIDSVCTLKKENTPPIFEGADYFMGVDIGRLGGDESSFEVLQLNSNGELNHIYSETAVKKLTTWTEDRIVELTKLFKFRRVYIDAGAGSLGVGVFDHLLKLPETKYRVIAINNRKIIVDRITDSKQRILKEDLYDNLKALGEKGKLKLLKDDNVIASLKSVQFEYSDTDMSGTSKVKIFGNYTHIVEGLIRAAWCTKEKSLNFHIYSM